MKAWKPEWGFLWRSDEIKAQRNMTSVFNCSLQLRPRLCPLSIAVLQTAFFAQGEMLSGPSSALWCCECMLREMEGSFVHLKIHVLEYLNATKIPDLIVTLPQHDGVIDSTY